jgi:hypothetical protein
MPLSCYQISPPPASASQIMENEFNYAANAIFENCLDVFTVERESIFGSNVYSNVRARITSAISSLTSKLLGDDFKQIIHNPADGIELKLGDTYKFNDCWWISIFSDAIKSVISNGTVRRANNMLKWIDENGVLYLEPCIIDTEITGNRNLTRQDDVVLPQGYVKIFTQANNRTEKIKPNQRFLVGRPNQQVCWRVLGNGEMNAQDLITDDNTSSRLLTLTVDAYQINEQTDDLINGIADAFKSVYTITLSSSSISGNTTETYPLNATLLLNNLPTSGSLTYTTSSSSIATISASGLLTLNSTGSTIATAYMGGNPTISASATIIVTSSGTTTNEVRINPSDNISIIEGESQTFTSYLYTNGVQQADVFTFTLANSNVPTNRYVLSTLSNNSFSVENVNMYLDYPLLILATSGSYTKQISIMLAGAF